MLICVEIEYSRSKCFEHLSNIEGSTATLYTLPVARLLQYSRHGRTERSELLALGSAISRLWQTFRFKLSPMAVTDGWPG